MPSSQSLPSYRNVPPLEDGGVISRRGLEFQDHVAAGYCIDMLADPKLLEVWCESLDDITLIWSNGQQEEYEFVQVKTSTFNHLWSVAELCKQEKKGGSSILEKSLANERGSEECRFRIVTSWDINSDLKVLKLPLNSPARDLLDKDFVNLCNKISGKIIFKSPKGSDSSSWLSRTIWQVWHSTQNLENENLLKLQKVGHSLDIFLAIDQWNEMYRKILNKVQDAGNQKWESDSESKKIIKESFFLLIKELSENARHPGLERKGGERLSEKMKQAQIPADSIETAQEQRRWYRSQILSPGYMDLNKRQEIEMNAQAQLHQILSQLDAGKLSDTGVQFHSRCLDLLSQISSTKEEISLPLLHGYMYYLANRCLHRFVRGSI